MGDNKNCVDNNNGDANDSVKKPTKDKMDAFSLHLRGEYESIATVGEIRVWWRADFQSGSRVLKKVF